MNDVIDPGIAGHSIRLGSYDHWLALAVWSEARDQPHEWPYIADVIMNRVDSHRFPGTVWEVVTQRKQFSWFNKFDDHGETGSHGRRAKALRVVSSPEWGELANHDILSGWVRLKYLPDRRIGVRYLGTKVFHCWAPDAMATESGDPYWVSDMKRVIDIPHLPRWRFGESW